MSSNSNQHTFKGLLGTRVHHFPSDGGGVRVPCNKDNLAGGSAIICGGEIKIEIEIEIEIDMEEEDMKLWIDVGLGYLSICCRLVVLCCLLDVSQCYFKQN